MAIQSAQTDDMNLDVAEDEADRMSIDGDDEDPTNRYYQPAEPSRGELSYSDTDEEPWDAMGDALRQSSFSGGGRSRYYSMRSRSRPSISRSTPSRSAPHNRPNFATLDFSGVDVDSQERAAIEALMRMGSM